LNSYRVQTDQKIHLEEPIVLKERTMPSRPLISEDWKLYNTQLTSLRGVAWLVVLAGHIIQVINYRLPPAGSLQRSLRTLVACAFSAEGAVLLFFALNGCVLAISPNNVTKLHRRAVLGFYVKRMAHDGIGHGNA
jgi:peptidoglycan/LPS O-acetylase OafA/YrhL